MGNRMIAYLVRELQRQQAVRERNKRQAEAEAEGNGEGEPKRKAKEKRGVTLQFLQVRGRVPRGLWLGECWAVRW